MAKKQFVHLHTHSHYSLLDGLSKIEDMVAEAKKNGMTAIALTDHGSMYGAIDFYKECKKYGIKPIIGVEAYIAKRTRLDKEPGLDNKRYHLTLLAKNIAGYKNLIKLVTKSNLEGYYYKPRMDKDILQEHSDGVICLTGCPASEFIHHIKNKNIDKAKELIKFYIEIFGRENVFLEVMKHDDVEWYIPLIEDIKNIAKEMDMPIVGTWDSHYLHKDDNEAQDTLVAINTGSEVGMSGMSMKAGDYSFIGPNEAHEIFKDIPDAIENTMKIADMVDLELTLGKFIFPNFELPDNTTGDDVLKDLCYKGIIRRNMEGRIDVIERLEYELGIIKFKGYASYFLVVEDLIHFADENKILSNIRGSVAGSITTYLLGITKIDPLEYKIPFERFLNPERPSAPDIDMDFADNRRDEVIEYAKRKYGSDKVAQIGTFGTMMARGSVRDTARALGYPYGVGDRLSKLIPMGAQGSPMTIKKAMKIVPELKEAYEKETDTKKIFDLAMRIEGCARHISVHAAGVVISPEPLTEYVPLQFDPKGGKIITQYDMYSVGEDGVGLTKFDFLGIRNLSILADTISLVEKLHNIKIDLDNIPIDDKKTFALLAKGDTEGLFQLNGSGITRYLKELKPSTIHDINAMVALYRPGPMQFIPDFIARKHNSKLISYLDPALEKILEQTYGVLVYQDDLLIMAHDLAGYSWGEVDKFRKAVGKKIPEEMAAQKEKFIKGCIKHSGWNEKKATEIWKWIEPFAAYGFNKAHSASYGRVAYQTAYMKANFPVEYMSAILTAESGDVEKVGIMIHECKNMNIPVLPPDINESFGGFTVVREKSEDKGKIRFGLYTIKNFGTDIGDAIITERKKNGHFTSISNFLERITHKNLNKKSLESLVKAGAMDNLGDRGEMMANTESMLEYNKESRGNKDQTSLFGMMEQSSIPSFKLKPVTDIISQQTRLAWEKELLGLYVSGHPLDRIRDKLEKRDINIKKIFDEGKENVPVVIAGIIEDLRPVITKNNDKMAFIKITDFTGTIEAVIFPKLYKEIGTFFELEKCVAVQGRISLRNGEKSIIIEGAKLI